MSNISKNLLFAFRKRWEELIKQPKKLLIMAAVILFILFLISRSDYSFKGQGQEAGLSSVASSEELITETADEVGFLGGPVLNFEQSFIGQPLAALVDDSVDFSADDETENNDLAIIQENSLLAPNSPLIGDIFRSFRKEVVTYLVESGDNPEKIALSFGLNTNTLLWANNLKDGDLIRPGDKLIILPINGVRIKVGSGETVGSLAKKYQGKSEEIIAFNSLPADGSLKVGDFIIIPGGEMPAPPKPKITAPRYASSVQRADWLIIPTSGRNWGRIHGFNGVDISNDCGTPIYAAAAGRVITSDGIGWNGGYGKYIKIQHPNGVTTVYAHASSLLVDEGENVSQGQLIAYMGITGRSTGCHLHFEVRGARNPLAR